MLPYRAYYPNAGVVLPNTRTIAERVIVLPTGSSMDAVGISGVLQILALLGRTGRQGDRVER